MQAVKIPIAASFSNHADQVRRVFFPKSGDAAQDGVPGILQVGQISGNTARLSVGHLGGFDQPEAGMDAAVLEDGVGFEHRQINVCEDGCGAAGAVSSLGCVGNKHVNHVDRFNRLGKGRGNQPRPREAKQCNQARSDGNPGKITPRAVHDG